MANFGLLSVDGGSIWSEKSCSGLPIEKRQSQNDSIHGCCSIISIPFYSSLKPVIDVVDACFPSTLATQKLFFTLGLRHPRKTHHKSFGAHGDYLLNDITTLKYLQKLPFHFLTMARKKGPVIGLEEDPKPKGAAPGVDAMETPSGSFSTSSATSTCPHCNSAFQDLSAAVCLPCDIVDIIISTITDLI